MVMEGEVGGSEGREPMSHVLTVDTSDSLNQAGVLRLL